jgi:ectoine hydroxylase-related dioxygenase (phytanoyl-CoA dioxygenase family)
MEERYMSHIVSSANSGRWHSELMEHGYCIIPDAIDPDIASTLDRDLKERFVHTPFCMGEFYGEHTKRFGSLLKRSRYAASLVAHPLIISVAEAVLRPFCESLQLNLTQAVQLHPGAEEQPSHRDQDMWGGPKGEIEYLLNVMWPLTNFTKENGATLIWPGSHRHQQDYFLPHSDAMAAEMPVGSALLFLGSTLHGGGANRSRLPRTGLIVSYCLGWLKPFENQWLAYPPSVARQFPRELAELVGYSIHRPNLGNYEGKSPAVLLAPHPPSEFLAAEDALLPEHYEFIAELKRHRMRAAA